MRTVGNLLVMEHCASCERELAPTWKFCLYCGRPLVLASEGHPKRGAEPKLTSGVSPELKLEPGAEPVPEVEAGVNAIPAAIRGEPEEPHRRKYGGAFWVGVGMGALGLVLVIYAAVQIIGSHA